MAKTSQKLILDTFFHQKTVWELDHQFFFIKTTLNKWYKKYNY